MGEDFDLRACTIGAAGRVEFVSEDRLREVEKVAAAISDPRYNFYVRLFASRLKLEALLGEKLSLAWFDEADCSAWTGKERSNLAHSPDIVANCASTILRCLQQHGQELWQELRIGERHYKYAFYVRYPGEAEESCRTIERRVRMFVEDRLGLFVAEDEIICSYEGDPTIQQLTYMADCCTLRGCEAVEMPDKKRMRHRDRPLRYRQGERQMVLEPFRYTVYHVYKNSLEAIVAYCEFAKQHQWLVQAEVT